MKCLRSLGPGLLVTAAFVGPGTITTASKAGAEFGFALLWAVVFSIFATIALQEMASRLGLVTRKGLGANLRNMSDRTTVRVAVTVLVLGAILIGNSAYQGGNLAGSAAGLSLISCVGETVWVVVIAAAALVLLWLDRYRLLEIVLIALVGVMSVTFLTAAILVQPSVSDMMYGMIVPSVPAESMLTIIALIGTTVVPYNLFLHASAVCEKWPPTNPLSESLSESRTDAMLSIGLGGLITIAIVATSAAAFFGNHVTIETAADMSRQLRPLLGDGADILLPLGLFAAGLTSSITAPLAAAIATMEILGWSRRRHRFRFAIICAMVLSAGVAMNLVFQGNTLPLILFAQAANGLLLPIIAIFLLYVVNRSEVMGAYKNGIWSNLIGGLVLLVATGLGVYHLWRAIGRALGQ